MQIYRVVIDDGPRQPVVTGKTRRVKFQPGDTVRCADGLERQVRHQANSLVLVHGLPRPLVAKTLTLTRCVGD